MPPRRRACRLAEERYRDLLNAEQIRLLRRTSFYFEFHRRVVRYGQSLSTFSDFVGYLWYGGKVPSLRSFLRAWVRYVYIWSVRFPPFFHGLRWLKHRGGNSFILSRWRRRLRYRSFRVGAHVDSTLLKRLRSDGYAVIRRAVNPEALQKIREEFEKLLACGEGLNRVSKDSIRTEGDRSAPQVFLTDEEIARGETFYRRHTNQVSVAEPFIRIPWILPVALGDLLIEIAGVYLGCLPAVGGVNLRKSFANGLPEFDTNYFHSDGNSSRFLKFFFYLNDVDSQGGPFCYVRGSHRRKFRGWGKKYRWTPPEIAAIYREESMVELTGTLGDLVVADTTGFHRGTKVRSYDRSMLTVNYVVHREYEGRTPPPKLLRADYERLSEKQKAVADFLEVV